MYDVSMHMAMDEGRDRINNQDVFFMDTVKELLSSTRLLVYS